LAAAWEAEVSAARNLTAIAERALNTSQRARLLVLSAFCRAHASRLLARLTAMGRGPLPVPSEPEQEEELRDALMHESSRARLSAGRYGQLALMARAQGDVSSAWVCELNRTEEEDRYREMQQMLESLPQVTPAAHASSDR
jgi:hypothetical protein